MQTRRLRLGDVVDDYCPRERRLSNHVIAAMVGDTIKQTRCSTCDFEHPYKEAKIPARRKKKDATSELFQQVLDNVTEGMKPPATAASDASDDVVMPAEEQVTPAPVAAAPEPEPEPVPEAAPAPAPRRRASKRTAAAAKAAPLFQAESETPAPAAIASATAVSASATSSTERPVVAPAAAAASTGKAAHAAASAARPAVSTPASSGLPPATLVKTPATPAPAARPAAATAAASAQASPAPAAPGTAARGVLRPAAPRETPAGGSQNQPAQPAALAASPASPDDAGNAAEAAKEEDAPLHRRALIRATLPRPVGEVPVRAIPTFTIREAAAARPNKFRHKGRPNGAARQSRAPIGPMSMGNNQARPGTTRGPQGRGGAAKKAGGHQPHRAGGHQPRGPKGQGGGGKRFK
jgi:hypothetical protein